MLAQSLIYNNSLEMSFLRRVQCFWIIEEQSKNRRSTGTTVTCMMRKSSAMRNKLEKTFFDRFFTKEEYHQFHVHDLNWRIYHHLIRHSLVVDHKFPLKCFVQQVQYNLFGIFFQKLWQIFFLIFPHLLFSNKKLVFDNCFCSIIKN